MIFSDKHLPTFCSNCPFLYKRRLLSQHRARQWSESNLSQICRNSSSRSLLTGELPDTLGLLRLIDSKSLHRRIKSQRRLERVAATNHLSLWSRAPQTSIAHACREFMWCCVWDVVCVLVCVGAVPKKNNEISIFVVRQFRNCLITTTVIFIKKFVCSSLSFWVSSRDPRSITKTGIFITDLGLPPKNHQTKKLFCGGMKRCQCNQSMLKTNCVFTQKGI